MLAGLGKYLQASRLLLSLERREAALTPDHEEQLVLTVQSQEVNFRQRPSGPGKLGCHFCSGLLPRQRHCVLQHKDGALGTWYFWELSKLCPN